MRPVSNLGTLLITLSTLVLAPLAIHALCVYLRGPQAAMRGFVAAVQRGDAAAILTWSLPDERQAGLTVDRIDAALKKTLFKDTDRLTYRFVSYPHDNDFPHSWYRWVVSWGDARGRHRFSSLDPQGFCPTGINAVPSTEGWRISFTQFVRSFFFLTEVQPMLQSGKLRPGSHPQYIRSRIKAVAGVELYPEPGDPYLRKPYRDFPAVPVAILATAGLIAGLVAELLARKSAPPDKKTRLPVTVLGSLCLALLSGPRSFAYAAVVGNCGAEPPPGVVLGLPIDHLVYYYLGISSVLELNKQQVARLNAVLKEKTGDKTPWWDQRDSRDRGLEKAIRGILDKRQNELRDRLIKAMKQAEEETKDDPPGDLIPGKAMYDTGMPYKTATAFAIKKRLNSLLTPKQWSLLDEAAKGLEARGLRQCSSGIPRRIN